MYKKLRLAINPGEKLVLVLNGGNGIHACKFLDEGDDWVDIGCVIAPVKVEARLVASDESKFQKLVRVRKTYYVLDSVAKTLRRANMGSWGNMFPEGYSKPVLIPSDTRTMSVDVQHWPNGYVMLCAKKQKNNAGDEDSSVLYVADLHRNVNEVHEMRLMVLS